MSETHSMISIRLTHSDREKLKAAAKLESRMESSFVRLYALAAADRILAEAEAKEKTVEFPDQPPPETTP